MRSILQPLISCFFSLVAVAPNAVNAQGAPRGLYGKSVVLNWVNSVVQVGADGRSSNPTIAAQRVAYISSAGRLFVRASRSHVGSGRRRQSDIAPGDTQNRGGEPVQMRFEGGRLVSTVGFIAGAGRAVATFDPLFQSCSLEVIYGKVAGGGMSRKGIDGTVYRIQSITTLSKSCTVQDGNALASN